MYKYKAKICKRYYTAPGDIYHSEEKLLQLLANVAPDLNGPHNFYLWTVKSPCTGTPLRETDTRQIGKSCPQDIFTFTRQYAMTRRHTVHVGFNNWYISITERGVTIADARRRFCAKVNTEKGRNGKAIIFSGSLSFTKIREEDGDGKYVPTGC